MPTTIRVHEQGLEIKKSRGITSISTNTLWIEKGIAVVDVIANFNVAIADEAEARDAAITAEAQLRIQEDQVLAGYIENLNSQFNTNLASIETELTVVTNSVTALANRTFILEVKTEDVKVSLNEQATIIAGQFRHTDGSDPIPGDIKTELGVNYQYINDTIGWVIYNDTALGTANQVKGWLVGAASLVVDPITGFVTGWQYGDGSGFDSFFKISAENIELAGSATFSEYAKITYVDDSVANVLSAAANAQSTADGKIESFYQATQPALASEGDIWFDTGNGNEIHTYIGGSWTSASDNKIALAINSAQTAQTTADGKAIVHYQNDAPAGLTAIDKGDIWIDTNDNNRFWVWSGSAWSLGVSDLAKADMSNVTTIDGGKITTGIIYDTSYYTSGGTSYKMKINLLEGEIHIK